MPFNALATPTTTGRLFRLGPLAPLLIFVASGLLYLINLGHAPASDELYHLLAARGLLEHGEPRIADGLYTRVFAYTWLIGQMFAWFGESLFVARIPSVLFLAALNTLIFILVRKEAGWLAAMLATGLFAISPFAVEIAQFARFYAAQGFFFFAGCMLIYELVRWVPPSSRRILPYGLAAASCFVAAIYLQPTTLLGLVGLGLWLVTAIGLPWLADPEVSSRRKVQVLVTAAALGLVVFGVLLFAGFVEEMWQRFRWTPGFLAPRVNEFWFYHIFYMLYYPSLWPIIGLLCLPALALWPRLTWFAMVIFATGFLLNSFAGPKNVRYLAYAQPFLFIIFGLSLAAVLPWLKNAGRTFKQQLEAHLGRIGLAGRRLPEALICGALLAALLTNGAFLRTTAQLADITVPPLTPRAEWQETLPFIEPLLGGTEVVVTMVELQTLYFWKHYDILFSPSRLSEMSGKGEFDADFRTGRPVISTVDSLAQLVNCSQTGLFVGPNDRWRQPQFIDLETADFIERTLTRLDLPRHLRMMAFTWDHRPADATSEECAAIRELLQSSKE